LGAQLGPGGGGNYVQLRTRQPPRMTKADWTAGRERRDIGKDTSVRGGHGAATQP
jgi:hypothetical protein